MRRGSRCALVMAILLAIAPDESRAQFGNGYYPGGYANYGWGGWAGTGTVEGNIARGLGYYAAGAGVLREDAAAANAINANAVIRWNQHLYQAQLEQNRREQQRLARRKDRVAESLDAIGKRLREKPSADDIADGAALNVVLDDLTDPRIHGSALRMAKTPIKGSTIRSIPFNDASEAVTISINQLVAEDDAWPPALRGDDFRSGREAYRQAIAAAMKEDEEGEISPRTLRDVRNAVADLRVQANKSIRKPSPDYLQAQQYIQALSGMTRMLENPNIEPVLKELEEIENTTVGNLLGFMHTFNLRFGQATTPEQRAIYTDLYPILVSHRDQVIKEAGIPPKATEKDEEGVSPTDFFQGLERDQPEGRNEGDNPPPPPTPAPAPAPQ